MTAVKTTFAGGKNPFLGCRIGIENGKITSDLKAVLRFAPTFQNRDVCAILSVKTQYAVVIIKKWRALGLVEYAGKNVSAALYQATHAGMELLK